MNHVSTFSLTKTPISGLPDAARRIMANGNNLVSLPGGNFLVIPALDYAAEGIQTLRFLTHEGNHYTEFESGQWGEDPELIMAAVWATILKVKGDTNHGIDPNNTATLVVGSTVDPDLTATGYRDEMGDIPTVTQSSALHGISDMAVKTCVVSLKELCSLLGCGKDTEILASFVRCGYSMEYGVFSYSQAVKTFFIINQDRMAKAMIDHAHAFKKVMGETDIDQITIHFK